MADDSLDLRKEQYNFLLNTEEVLFAQDPGKITNIEDILKKPILNESKEPYNCAFIYIADKKDKENTALLFNSVSSIFANEKWSDDFKDYKKAISIFDLLYLSDYNDKKKNF